MKRTIATLAAILMAGSLSACSQQEEASKFDSGSTDEAAFFQAWEIMADAGRPEIALLCEQLPIAGVDSIWAGFEPSYEQASGINVEKDWFIQATNETC